MKQGKLTVVVKELSGGHFHVKTLIIFSLSMLFFIFVLGMFINDRTRKFLTSDDLFPQLKAFPSVSPWPPSTHCQCNFSLSSHLLPLSFSNPRGLLLKDYTAPKELWHSMSEEELFWQESMVPRIVKYPYNRTPKVAFMYLTKGRLPFAPLWESFFKGHDGFYSVYLHAAPDFKNEPPESSVFYKRKIPSQVRTL